MKNIRRQLTLFLSENTGTIEKIRAQFNPAQFSLIATHVTLCREEEIEDIGKVKENLNSLHLPGPLCLAFGNVERSLDGKGALLPPAGENIVFHKVRKAILKGIVEHPRAHQPHITLMHPRNATCTDEIFDQLTQISFPPTFCFKTIHLIEQQDGGKWQVLEEFSITGSTHPYQRLSERCIQTKPE